MQHTGNRRRNVSLNRWSTQGDGIWGLRNVRINTNSGEKLRYAGVTRGDRSVQFNFRPTGRPVPFLQRKGRGVEKKGHFYPNHITFNKKRKRITDSIHLTNTRDRHIFLKNGKGGRNAGLADEPTKRLLRLKMASKQFTTEDKDGIPERENTQRTLPD